VTVAVCLLLYSLVVLMAGPPVLRRLTQTGDAPQLGVAAWVTAIGSVLLSWVAAMVLALADLAHHWRHPGAVLASCLEALRGLAAGNAGTVLQVGLLTLVGLGAVAITISAARLVRTLVRMRSRTHGHASAVRLVGRRLIGLDAVVIEAAEPAAYCIAGRPHAVVVTSAALDALTRPQLDAILAHERAHLDGRHPEIIAIARGLAATFPNLNLMSEGAHHISWLLEMCADDSAAGQHGAQPILGGLLALTGAVPVSSGALGASGIAVLARAERLAATRRAGFGGTALTAAVIAITAGGPAATAVLAAGGVLMCGIR
jgi:beta-lactamase regulating signal transducer with metallopeptidase domain